MNILNRLFLLCNQGLKKLAYLIREHLNLIEVKILFVGLVLTALTGIICSIFFLQTPAFTKCCLQPPSFMLWGAGAWEFSPVFPQAFPFFIRFYTIFSLKSLLFWLHTALWSW